jgi:uncharacterized protein (TIGR02246 family)
MIKNWKAPLILLGVSLVLSSFAGAQCAGSQTSPKSQKESGGAATTMTAQDDQEHAVRSVLHDLSQAVATGDADRTASFWSEDAVFIDEAGDESRGRAALRERFAKAFQQRTPSTIGLHPDRITLPASNVALVIGSVSSKSGDAIMPQARFSMVLVKQHDRWLINEATETVVQHTHAGDHLKELAWLIGKWQVNKPDSTTKLEADWAANKAFIHSKCVSSEKDGAQRVDSQVIGWDPRTKSIVSWHFDSNGGFGYGKWSKQPSGWQIDFAGVGADGSSTRAANIFTVKSPEEFTWQSVEQTSDGVAIADTDALQIQRAK